MSDQSAELTRNMIGATKLGRELKISPKSNVTINKPGYRIEFFETTVEVIIGIGKDHSAALIMCLDDFEAFRAGAELSIDTNKEFQKKFIKK